MYIEALKLKDFFKSFTNPELADFLEAGFEKSRDIWVVSIAEEFIVRSDDNSIITVLREAVENGQLTRGSSLAIQLANIFMDIGRPYPTLRAIARPLVIIPKDPTDKKWFDEALKGIYYNVVPRNSER